MGCSDRFDLDTCEYLLEIHTSGTRLVCGKLVRSGVYCQEHSKEALRKQDAESAIKRLKEKENQAVQKWLTKSD